MFGGFDSEFYDDLHALDLRALSNEEIAKKKAYQSRKDRDYAEMVNRQDCSNILIRLVDN